MRPVPPRPPRFTANWLDRAMAWVWPGTAVNRVAERARFTALTGDWNGGRKQDRRSLRNWRPLATSANEANSADLPYLRQRSRDLTRNAPFATGAISTITTNVIGDGLALKAAPDRDLLGLTDEAAVEWARNTQREWELFCERADFTGRLTFYEFQNLALRSALESGDVFVVRRNRPRQGDTYALKIQMIEADRCSNNRTPGGLPQSNTPNLVDGVRLDNDGRPTGYWFTNVHPDDSAPGASRTWKVYDSVGFDGRPLILHLYQMARPDQARGVPLLAPVVEALKQLSDYGDAELSAAVVNAMFTVFVKRPEIDPDADMPIVGEGYTTDTTLDQNEIKLGKGAIIDLAPGEDVVAPSPNRPNAAFNGFVDAICREIGAAIDLPFEVLVKNFNSSYSASRAALEVAWQTFRMRRSWIAWKFCQPVYEWFLTEAISSGRIAAPGFFNDPAIRAAWAYADWIGPSRISLDPQKEAAADQIDLQMGSKTLEQIILERTGGDWETKHEQRVREVKQRQADGLEQDPAEVAQQQADAAAASKKESDSNAKARAEEYRAASKRDDTRFERQMDFFQALLDRPPPVVNVSPPNIDVDAPVINFQPPNIVVEAPVINVSEAPITVESPTVNVTVPGRGTVVKDVTGYDEQGRITQITEREE